MRFRSAHPARRRRPPSLLNPARQRWFNRKGSADRRRVPVRGPVENPVEMGSARRHGPRVLPNDTDLSRRHTALSGEAPAAAAGPETSAAALPFSDGETAVCVNVGKGPAAFVTPSLRAGGAQPDAFMQLGQCATLAEVIDVHSGGQGIDLTAPHRETSVQPLRIGTQEKTALATFLLARSD